MQHVMSDIPLQMNGAGTDERPHPADERLDARGPIGRSKRVFGRMAVAVILIFWTAQFTTVTISRLVQMPEESLSFIEPRGVVTACAILLSFGILAVLRAVRGWTLLKRAWIAAGLAMAGCCIHTLINMCVFMLFSYFVADYTITDYVIAFAVSIFDFVWFYSALCVMLLALTYGEDLVENEDRIAALEAQANIAQLNALRYQLNPHFLFNTLNSVASLISKKMGPEAETMVVSLSDFLRSTLRMDSSREITLAEEIKLQSLYLDIEKARFPERLSVTIDVPVELSDACVPNLISQPLIENAIKHGVGRSSAPVHLEVIARALGGKLSLEVRDDGGNATGAPPPGTRVGLRNVAERLRLRFGEEASLTAGRRPEGGFSARILMPLRKA
jgi:two-component system LytT family sensor kinase